MFVRSYATAVRLVFAVLAISAFSAAANAAVYISYVASNGNDANPCTVVTAPCKTLARAYNVTSANGTIRVLTALQSNLTIAKNMTISGDGAPIVGTIVISGASTIATLRGLELNGVGIIASGIRIDSAAAVHIEDCTVKRYTNDGIKFVATTATKLFISDTVSSANGSDGLYADAINALAEIENSRFEGNASTGLYLKVAKASVLRSVSSGNAQHGIILRTPNAKVAETTANDNDALGMYSDLVSAKVEIESSRFEGNASTGLSLEVAKAIVNGTSASGNGQYGFILLSDRATITETKADDNSLDGFDVRSGFVVLNSVEASQNGERGVETDAGSSTILSDCMLAANIGFDFSNDGSATSYQNNVIGSSRGNPLVGFPLR
jgi:hypothetical protein